MGTVRVPGLLTRFVRSHGLVGSTLCRSTDRVEAGVVAVLALLALVVVPLAATVALGVYQRGLDEATATAAQPTKVTAVLVEDAVPRPAPSADRAFAPAVSALAQWELPNGQRGRGQLQVGADQRAGDQVPIWVDGAGQRTDAPTTRGDALVSALVVAADVVVLGWLLLGLVWWAASRVLGWINAARWDADWARTGPGWSHRSWQ
ncbi:MAG: Rv1733c family protein [Pseudonocardiaceae bacterium]